MGGGDLAPGSAGLHLVGGVALLRPEEQAFTAMLDGWRNQQLARRLAFSTVEARERVVRAFAAHADALPWLWTPAMVDDWMTDLRAVRHLRRSTLRSYQIAVRLFCQYITDPAYDWPGQCEARFGTHPVQVVHEWNAAVHVQDAEGDPRRRAFTRDELQDFLDYADNEVARIRKAGRKGWLPAFRDATVFKTAYGYGLRRNEARMLDMVDFGRNPHAGEFGERGVCYVRHGKAMAGSPPKPRSVLTVFGWVVDVLDEWTSTIRPVFGRDSPALRCVTSACPCPGWIPTLPRQRLRPGGQDRRWTPWAGLIGQPVEPACDEPRPPAVHRRRANAQRGGDLLVRLPFRAAQHDLRAYRQRLRGLRPPRPPRQLRALALAEHQIRLRPARTRLVSQPSQPVRGEP